MNSPKLLLIKLEREHFERALFELGFVAGAALGGIACSKNCIRKSGLQERAFEAGPHGRRLRALRAAQIRPHPSKESLLQVGAR